MILGEALGRHLAVGIVLEPIKPLAVEYPLISKIN
jgi:hypothetical protein